MGNYFKMSVFPTPEPQLVFCNFNSTGFILQKHTPVNLFLPVHPCFVFDGARTFLSQNSRKKNSCQKIEKKNKIKDIGNRNPQACKGPTDQKETRENSPYPALRCCWLLCGWLSALRTLSLGHCYKHAQQQLMFQCFTQSTSRVVLQHPFWIYLNHFLNKPIVDHQINQVVTINLMNEVYQG